MTLRVMTWNLWWRFGDHEARMRAVAEVIRSVDPDVLCVQEVWSDEHRDGAAELATAVGMHVTRTDPVYFRGESFGNAVLSRWPLRRLASEALPDTRGDSGHRRLVAAAVDTPWGAWPVASTHFDHRFDDSATRELQACHLLRRAVEWRGDPATDLPVIVGADLNAVPDADEIRVATGRRAGVPGIVFSDAWEQVGQGRGATWLSTNRHSALSAWPNRRIDYLLVSWPRPKPVGNPIAAWIVAHEPVDIGEREPIWASDHAAVVAEFMTPDAD